MKLNNLYALIFSFAVAACSAPNNNVQLQQEVIAVHDSIMPKMGVFVRDNLKIDLLLHGMDSLKKINPTMDTTLEKEKLNTLQSNLKVANEAMTDWMHDFDPIQEDKKPEEIQSYLQQELKKIQALKQKFTEVEKESELVLEKYK